MWSALLGSLDDWRQLVRLSEIPNLSTCGARKVFKRRGGRRALVVTRGTSVLKTNIQSCARNSALVTAGNHCFLSLNDFGRQIARRRGGSSAPLSNGKTTNIRQYTVAGQETGGLSLRISSQTLQFLSKIHLTPGTFDSYTSHGTSPPHSRQTTFHSLEAPNRRQSTTCFFCGVLAGRRSSFKEIAPSKKACCRLGFVLQRSSCRSYL